MDEVFNYPHPLLSKSQGFLSMILMAMQLKSELWIEGFSFFLKLLSKPQVDFPIRWPCNCKRLTQTLPQRAQIQPWVMKIKKIKSTSAWKPLWNEHETLVTICFENKSNHNQNWFPYLWSKHRINEGEIPPHANSSISWTGHRKEVEDSPCSKDLKSCCLCFTYF